jgi:diguanylate cyclase (GGDEF)-like protein
MQLGLALVLFPVVAFGDWVTGYEMAFGIFYIVPVALIARANGWTAGIVAAFTAALLWGLIEAESRPYSSPWYVFWNGAVRFGYFTLAGLYFAREQRLRQLEREMARTDSLTGAANSRAFLSELDSEILRVLRTGRPLTLAYVDVDNFKAVNDKHGHAAGDEVLRRIVTVLQRELRAVDLPARLGGDEFVLLLREADEAGARECVERIRKALRADVSAHWPVTFSVGVVTFAQPPSSAQEAVKRADSLMYRVKHSTKDAAAYEVVGRAA